MFQLQQLALGAALLAGALALSPQAASPVHGQPSTHDQLFPTPAEGMVFGEKDQTLQDAVREFGRVTGEVILLSPESRALLSNASFQLDSPLNVAPENVYSVMQDLLSQRRFAITVLRREEPRMLSIESLDSSNRASIKASAMFVPENEIEDYALDSAILLQTVLYLPHLDIRTTSNAFRQLVVDPNTMQVIPEPESNQLILTGLGRPFQGMVRVLRELNAGAAQHQNVRLKEALIEAAQRLGLEQE